MKPNQLPWGKPRGILLINKPEVIKYKVALEKVRSYRKLITISEMSGKFLSFCIDGIVKEGGSVVISMGLRKELIEAVINATT